MDFTIPRIERFHDNDAKEKGEVSQVPNDPGYRCLDNVRARFPRYFYYIFSRGTRPLATGTIEQSIGTIDSPR